MSGRDDGDKSTEVEVLKTGPLTFRLPNGSTATNDRHGDRKPLETNEPVCKLPDGANAKTESAPTRARGAALASATTTRRVAPTPSGGRRRSTAAPRDGSASFRICGTLSAELTAVAARPRDGSAGLRICGTLSAEFSCHVSYSDGGKVESAKRNAVKGTIGCPPPTVRSERGRSGPVDELIGLSISLIVVVLVVVYWFTTR